MSSDLEPILEAELVRLGRRGGMDRGMGAKLTARRLRTDRFEATIEARASAEAVTSRVVAAPGMLEPRSRGAKESLVGQRTAAQAVGRVLDALGAGRRRKRRRRDRGRPATPRPPAPPDGRRRG